MLRPLETGARAQSGASCQEHFRSGLLLVIKILGRIQGVSFSLQSPKQAPRRLLLFLRGSAYNWDQPETPDLSCGIYFPNPSTWAGTCQLLVRAVSSLRQPADLLGEWFEEQDFCWGWWWHHGILSFGDEVWGFLFVPFMLGVTGYCFWNDTIATIYTCHPASWTEALPNVF